MIDMISIFAEGASNWDLGSFLAGATNSIKGWGSLVIILIGIIMVIASVYQIAKGLMSRGRTQTNWGVVVLLLLVGGAFMVGGFEFVSNIAEGGKKTIEDLGGGAGNMIIPRLFGR